MLGEACFREEEAPAGLPRARQQGGRAAGPLDVPEGSANTTRRLQADVPSVALLGSSVLREGKGPLFGLIEFSQRSAHSVE